jgi:RAT1-interacting protein
MLMDHKRKLLKFYFQSFLLGVPVSFPYFHSYDINVPFFRRQEIVVGFRTPVGVISTVQSFKTIQLPRLVRSKPGAWDPLLSLNWGYQFLTFLKDVIRKEAGVENDLAVAVWRATFVPGSGVNVERLDASAIEDVVDGEDRVGFLPRWYWDEIHAEKRGNPEEVNSAPVSRITGWQI